jgi:catechol 2,3-dioxygenase-like lactoylglutathione lyase family enzyme
MDAKRRPPHAQLSHLGFIVNDLDRMIEFYTRVLGMVLTDRGAYSRGGNIAFLSRDPAEHHQVVFATGRPPEMRTTINQISFLVEELEELREFHALLVEEGVAGLEPRNHGNAWSIYFLDPEGNRIELYTPTPWHVGQPFGKPLDLTESADTIRDKTWALVRDDPTHVPREQWAGELAQKIRNAL